jgi:DNA-binding XRE family transcriptional regulator
MGSKKTDEGTDSMRMWGLLMRRFRLAAGITHEELAQHVGYSKSLVVGIERGPGCRARCSSPGPTNTSKPTGG